MPTTRRQFIDSLAASTLAIGALPAALDALPAAPTTDTHAEANADANAARSPLGSGFAQGTWDTNWGSRLTGRLKTVFDVPEIESGFPVWRASIWSGQYEQVLNVPSRETSTALVLRHNAIALAMQQSYWDRYGLGAAFKVTNPLTGQPSTRNVALLGAADGVPEPYSTFALDKFMGRGGVALACDLALRLLVTPMVAKVDGLADGPAYERARQGLVPGVILQPSGMFAVIRAQEAGAFYFRAG